MQFNRNTTIRFVYNGKNYKYNIKFSHYLYNVVPIYISEEAKEVIALELDNGSILTIIPESINKDIDSVSLEIIIINTILKTYYKSDKNTYTIDLLCSHWFGFTRTIDTINTHVKCSLQEKIHRTEALENVLRNNISIKLPDIDSVITKIKFVDIV